MWKDRAEFGVANRTEFEAQSSEDHLPKYEAVTPPTSNELRRKMFFLEMYISFQTWQVLWYLC